MFELILFYSKQRLDINNNRANRNVGINIILVTI